MQKLKTVKGFHGMKKYYVDNVLVAIYVPILQHATGLGYKIEKTDESFSNYKEMKARLLDAKR